MTAGVLEVVHMSGSISSIVFGLAVVAVGLVLLLNNLGVTGIDVGTLVGRVLAGHTGGHGPLELGGPAGRARRWRR